MIKQDKQDYKPNFTQVKQAERDKGSVVFVVVVVYLCVSDFLQLIFSASHKN